MYVVSCNQSLTAKLSTAKLNNHTIFGTNKWQYGDLYGLSNLSYFRKNFKDPKPAGSTVCNAKNDINLYVACDSYVWGFFKTNEAYCGVKNLYLIKTNGNEVFTQTIDTSANNVLLLECAERNLPGLFGDSLRYESLYASGPQQAQAKEKIASPKASFFASVYSFRTKIFDFLFN